MPAPLKPLPGLTSLSAPRGRWSWRTGPPIGLPSHVSGSLSSGSRGGQRWGLRPLGVRAGKDVGEDEVDRHGGQQTPLGSEELVLTPTGAWQEVVGGSGTLSQPILVQDTDPGAPIQPVPLPPSVPHPTPTIPKPIPVGSTAALLGVPLHSDSHEDAGTLDFSSLLKKR